MTPTQSFRRNDLLELLIKLVPEHTPLTYLTDVNRIITFTHPDGRRFTVAIEAEWPHGRPEQPT